MRQIDPFSACEWFHFFFGSFRVFFFLRAGAASGRSRKAVLTQSSSRPRWPPVAFFLVSLRSFARAAEGSGLETRSRRRATNSRGDCSRLQFSALPRAALDETFAAIFGFQSPLYVLVRTVGDR